MQRFDRPAGLDELPRQPVEQFRVRGPLAFGTEVARRADDPFAEVMLPDAVDHHTGRQRVVCGPEPASQLRPAAARADRRLPVFRQGQRKTPAHSLAELVIVATVVDRRIAEPGVKAVFQSNFLDAVGAWQRREL